MASEISLSLRQTSESTTETTIRGHEVRIDRPVPKGGLDAGPMGGELFLAAAGGCFMSNLLAAVKTRNAAVSEVQTEVKGILAESPARFIALDLQVSAQCEDRSLLEKLVGIADKGCIMMNTLRGTLELTVRVADLETKH
ncbi:MAG: OsmC family protein [Bryobacteraceae bacterium]|nr:OsmC family protein [Bryobacteraceae bacterium]